MEAVAADAADVVASIREKHCVVFGNRTVPRIGQPEVLPHDDAMAIAGLIKGIVADLADPVADHGEVHLAVVTDGGVVLAGAVAQLRLRQTPSCHRVAMKRRPLMNRSKLAAVFVARSSAGCRL